MKLIKAIIILTFFCACTTSQQKKDIVKSDTNFRGPFSIDGYNLYEYSHWYVQHEDAEKYDSNAYYTQNKTKFSDANSIIFFYFEEKLGKTLDQYVQGDREYFVKNFPGITVKEYDVGDLNFNNFPAKYKKNFKVYLYDYRTMSYSYNKKSHKIEIVIFFEFASKRPYYGVLALTSLDDDAFNHVEDLKKIFISLMEDENAKIYY